MFLPAKVNKNGGSIPHTPKQPLTPPAQYSQASRSQIG